MRRNIRVKELHTPCAGHRPGAADPKRSKAAYPPPRWVFGAPGTENIDFWCSRDKNIDFWCPGDKNIDFILIFGAPGTENINFWCSGERKY